MTANCDHKVAKSKHRTPSASARRIRIARRILQMATDERIKAFARTYISERTS